MGSTGDRGQKVSGRAETLDRRLVAAASALAGCLGTAALFVSWQVLDPGRAGADPQPRLTRRSLGQTLALTDEPMLNLSGYAMAAASILILVFAIQLAARLGTRRDAASTWSAFTIGVGSLIAMLLVIEFGLAVGLGESALTADLYGTLLAYFMWEWWVAKFLGIAFACLMTTVAIRGVHDIAFPSTARWATIVTLIVIVSVTVMGFGGLTLLIGGVWVAGMSVGMALHALLRRDVAPVS
ncbi:hypothetical protein [Diaminobutyricimonas sp. LJ205]|uniref:hypothetical protein n=1 Tax=Diaminobutyricimonas sp. LJ205 TaxID=2683590 RepID=UPI0012F4A72F|nr:hypothetical protein [Diaminobutyricimonas sp. LJ205]